MATITLTLQTRIDNVGCGGQVALCLCEPYKEFAPTPAGVILGTVTIGPDKLYRGIQLNECGKRERAYNFRYTIEYDETQLSAGAPDPLTCEHVCEVHAFNCKDQYLATLGAAGGPGLASVVTNNSDGTYTHTNGAGISTTITTVSGDADNIIDVGTDNGPHLTCDKVQQELSAQPLNCAGLTP